MADELGERLLQAGKIKEADLERASRAQQQTGQPLGSVLLKLGLVAEKDLVGVLSEQLDVALAAPEDYPDLPVLEGELTHAFIKEHGIIPLREEDGKVVLAMTSPDDEFVKRAVSMATNRPVDALLAMPSDVEAAFERLYGSGGGSDGGIERLESPSEDVESEDVQQLRDRASEGPVIRLVNSLISRALEAGASDIHIEPFENRLQVRYRIDGVVHEVDTPHLSLKAAIISRIKIMARLNIAERRLPQDGRIWLRTQGKEIDLRVSTVPTMFGESVVMRILDREAVSLDLADLGFSPEVLKGLTGLLQMPHGIILATGPTGSGKTTTLYAALSRLNTPERKILTVEDPVEYQLAGINQIHVKPKIGLDFASALRAILRQDPDVIMVGEMRDLETARIAVQSALTGHLVLSTLHTNDAAGGVTRLLDMGVEDYLLTSTVSGILAQRLVRRPCSYCAESYALSPDMAREMGLERFIDREDAKLWRAVGCKHCSGTGYRGRTAVHELLVMDESIRRLVLSHASTSEVESAARAGGMFTMYEDGARKALRGETTIEEVLRVTEETSDADV